MHLNANKESKIQTNSLVIRVWGKSFLYTFNSSPVDFERPMHVSNWAMQRVFAGRTNLLASRNNAKSAANFNQYTMHAHAIYLLHAVEEQREKGMDGEWKELRDGDGDRKTNGGEGVEAKRRQKEELRKKSMGKGQTNT
uniref:Uncharacterized protein n=1 Tax=Globodera rostochiensis TaxID=31243 RepID=A0A914HEN0_GLORO